MTTDTIRFLIFDLDGTLIDSSRGIAEAVNHSLRAHGEPERSLDEITPYIGFPLREMYADFTDAPYEKLYASFQEVARRSVVESAEPLPGVHEVLTELSTERFRMALATNKISVHIRSILQKLGWVDFFAATVGGDEVRHQKPHPEMLMLAMQRLVAIPEQTIMVGDTRNDILAAKSIGLRTVVVDSPYGHDVPEPADIRIANLSELMDIIKGKGAGVA